MFKSFRIKNFRCFKELTLEPLERLNLITGKNNAGKTSFLEALFLHVGPNNPDLPLRVNVFRGIEYFPVEPEELWGSLFFNKNIEGSIELASLSKEDEHNTLKITLEQTEESFITPPVSGTTSTTTTSTTASIDTQMSQFPVSKELLLTYINETGRESVARAFINQKGEIKGKRSEIKHKLPGVFLPARSRFLGTDADRYSKLDRKGKIEPVLNALKLLEPRLERLAVLVEGGFPMINGDIGLNELIPVPMMGEGMVRLLSILLAIYDSTDGIILIDEIENGLHHTVMSKVWKAIAKAATQSNTQIFATTHSGECVESYISALSDLVDDDSVDGMLFRLDKSREEIQSVPYNLNDLSLIAEQKIEVR